MQEKISTYKPLMLLFDAVKDRCPDGNRLYGAME